MKKPLKPELTHKEFAALGGQAKLKKYGTKGYSEMGKKGGGRPKKKVVEVNKLTQ